MKLPARIDPIMNGSLSDIIDTMRALAREISSFRTRIESNVENSAKFVIQCCNVSLFEM